MKTTTIALCLIVIIGSSAQAQHSMANRDKMKAFDGWAGRWEGEGWMQMGPGEPKKSNVIEIITPKLDGLVYLVEGRGTLPEGEPGAGKVVHDALGILSYDQSTDQYKFRSYVQSGHTTDAWFNLVDTNKFQWGFDIPNYGKMRYTITLDPAASTWNEIGEFSSDGATWVKNFEMNLKKVD